jgi:hypothetical protein
MFFIQEEVLLPTCHATHQNLKQWNIMSIELNKNLLSNSQSFANVGKKSLGFGSPP